MRRHRQRGSVHQVETSEQPAVEPSASAGDVQSDPSLDDGTHADWTAEGGATVDGPATAQKAAHETEGHELD